MCEYHQNQRDLCRSSLGIVHSAEGIVKFGKPGLNGRPVKEAVGWHGEVEVPINQLLRNIPWDHHAEGQVCVHRRKGRVAEGEDAVRVGERGRLTQTLLHSLQERDARSGAYVFSV